VGKQAETCVEVQISFVAREVFKMDSSTPISFYGNGGTKFPKTAEQRFVHDFVIDRQVASRVALNSSAGASASFIFTGASPLSGYGLDRAASKGPGMADVSCDGSSFAKAIVVKAPTDQAGVDAEHDYIAQHFGKWRSIGVKSVEYDKHLFDIMRFTTMDGKQHILYFDITDYYGKL
jgi:hypothetical protein